MFGKKLTRVEEWLLCGPTWATKTTSFRNRLLYFRDIGDWPGFRSKVFTEMSMRGNIRAERDAGKTFCAEQKTLRARNVGLDMEYILRRS